MLFEEKRALSIDRPDRPSRRARRASRSSRRVVAQNARTAVQISWRTLICWGTRTRSAQRQRLSRGGGGSAGHSSRMSAFSVGEKAVSSPVRSAASCCRRSRLSAARARSSSPSSSSQCRLEQLALLRSRSASLCVRREATAGPRPPPSRKLPESLRARFSSPAARESFKKFPRRKQEGDTGRRAGPRRASSALCHSAASARQSRCE